MGSDEAATRMPRTIKRAFRSLGQLVKASGPQLQGIMKEEMDRAKRIISGLQFSVIGRILITRHQTFPCLKGGRTQKLAVLVKRALTQILRRKGLKPGSLEISLGVAFQYLRDDALVRSFSLIS